MAAETVEILTKAKPDRVWDAIRDIGALHTRLVPGFVLDTRLELGARVVTFNNGMIVREPIIAVDDERRRLVWSAEDAGLSHYNAAVQVFPAHEGSRVVWVADFLPHEEKSRVQRLMKEGISFLKTKMDSDAA
jgi:carbon monoxide dehydrogenase subunit G